MRPVCAGSDTQRPTTVQVCGGCGSRLPAVGGATHDYMVSSPACWAAFGTLMARHYSDPALMAIRRLSVDAWAVQHPGDGSRRAIQSVGVHLARLMVQLENGADGTEANEAMLRFARRKHTLPALPPRACYAMTVADVVGLVTPAAFAAAVRSWACAVWTDWADQREVIRAWAQRCGN